MNRKIPLLSILLPLALALPILIIGAVELAKVAQTVAASARATGTVVDNVLETFQGDQTAYVPVVEFVPEGSADAVRFTDDVGTDPPQFEVGEQVDVLYDPSNPQDARVATWMRLWFSPMVVIAFGVLPVVVGGVVWVWLRVRRSSYT